jgi:hypothetical protein
VWTYIDLGGRAEYDERRRQTRCLARHRHDSAPAVGQGRRGLVRRLGSGVLWCGRVVHGAVGAAARGRRVAGDR